jgi:hypothetical protein
MRRACVAAVLPAVWLLVPAAALATEPEQPVNTGGPSLVSLAAAPSSVSVATAPAVVGVTARLADPDGVASATVRFGVDGPVASLARVTGTATDGTWSGVATVPAFTPHGAVAAYVSLADSRGAVSAPVVTSAVAASDALPAAPVSLAVSATADGVLSVSWQEPPANGGSPVLSYDVSVLPAPGSLPSAVVPSVPVLGADARSVTVGGLSLSTRYVARVAARNAAGAGAVATADAFTDPGALTVPDVPTAVSAVPSDRALEVRWTPPASNGGVALTAFAVSALPRGEAPVPPVVTVAPDAVAALLPDLVNGVPYDVQVTAVNAVGAGLAGAASGTPRTVPSAPVVASVSASAGSASVAWSAPASSGGAAIESYVVTASPSGATVTVPGNTFRASVAGLQNGVATTFTVTASNAAGAGVPSAPSVAVTPRRAGRLRVLAQPAQQVKHGTATTVVASLVSPSGGGFAGQRVELLARVRPSTTWRVVAAVPTSSTGRAVLRAVLPATAALRLHHPASAVAAAVADVRPVYVAPRIGAAPSTSRVQAGTTLTIRGSIAPAHPTGSRVWLQRYVGGRWQTVGAGRLTSPTAYRITWRPGTTGSYPVRVVKVADGDHLRGTSRTWRQYVVAESAASLSRQIYANPRITLETTHDSGVLDLATARRNIVDVSGGGLARRSAYQNAPGGLTGLDRRLLRALRYMGTYGSVTVSEIAGGSHSRGSAHYSGRGLDISWVNGEHVAPGSDYGLAVRACRAYGASHIFHPAYDPVGGHQHHVHCDWS